MQLCVSKCPWDISIWMYSLKRKEKDPSTKHICLNPPLFLDLFS